MQLRIIDGAGPFFLQSTKEKINYSKTPFASFYVDGVFDNIALDESIKKAKEFCLVAKKIGYTAISYDDVAHIIAHPCYDDELKGLVAVWSKPLVSLLTFAKKQGLGVYLTTDILFTNRSIANYLQKTGKDPLDFLYEVCEQLFAQKIPLDGVIFRFGEVDGKDTKHHFGSKITIKTPKVARRYMQTLLPLFERHKKYFILRTWTVGIGKIGDLQWRLATFNKVFSGIDSDYLIISQKSTTTDFFRTTEINPLLTCSSHKRIVELQTRREYEGFGQYVSYIGKYHAQLYEALRGYKHILGCHVWCQTGGWSKHKDITFVRDSSQWNELNTHVTASLFAGDSEAQAVASYAAFAKIKDTKTLQSFLETSDVVIANILYIQGFTQTDLYFRRVRLPPLLWVYWDNVVLSNFVRHLIRYSVTDFEAERQRTMEATRLLQQMATDAHTLGVDFSFQYDTFMLLARCKLSFFLPATKARQTQLESAIAEYESRYPQGYEFYINKLGSKISLLFWSLGFRILLRKRKQYRLLDRMLYQTSLRRILFVLLRLYVRRLPAFARESAMGISAVLR